METPTRQEVGEQTHPKDGPQCMNDLSAFKARIRQELRADRRLRILQILLHTPAYQTNENVLQCLLYVLGHCISGDALRSDLTWLQEQGLIDVHEAHCLWVARLLDRGEEFCRGGVTQNGIAKPKPK